MKRILLSVIAIIAFNFAYSQGVNVQLIAKSTPNANATNTVQVVVSNFTNVTTLQFSLMWNPDQLNFKGLNNFNLNYLTNSNFNLNITEEGRIAVSWDDESSQGISLPNGTSIFELDFDLLNQGLVLLEFTESPTPYEASKNFQTVTFTGKGTCFCQ
jgi:hypothetical protein